jgi:hypothetical protein
LNLTLHSEIQLKALHELPVSQRIAHLDSTGSLVNLSKTMREYSRIMNYAMITKNSLKLNETDDRGLLINEAITSRQDTYSIGEMLRLFKYNYSSLYPNEEKILCMIVIDMSWASAYAAMEIFNLINLKDYAQKIFDFAIGKIGKTEIEKFVMIGICASHTMKRFSTNLKKKVKFDDKETRRFAMCCFSLLLNSTTLKIFGNILELIFKTFLSPSKTDSCLSSTKALQRLIEERPNEDDKIQLIIDEYVEFKSEIKHDIQESKASRTESFQEDDKPFDDKNDTIKKASPFTNYSLDIEDKVKKQIELEKNNEPSINQLFNTNFVNLLQQRFCPYAFLWSGFAFKALKTVEPISRLTNGCIEQHFKNIKKVVPSALLPASYINKVASISYGQAIEKLKSIANSDTESENESLSSSEEEECPIRALDIWKHRVKNKKIKKKTNTGVYQKSQKTLVKKKKNTSNIDTLNDEGKVSEEKVNGEICNSEIEDINSIKATNKATKDESWNNLIMLKINDICISKKAFDWLLNDNYLHETVIKYSF